MNCNTFLIIASLVLVHLSVAVHDAVHDKSGNQITLLDKIRNKIREFDEQHAGILSRIQRRNRTSHDGHFGGVTFRTWKTKKNVSDEQIKKILSRLHTRLMNNASKAELKSYNVVLIDKTNGTRRYRVYPEKAKELANNLTRPSTAKNMRYSLSRHTTAKDVRYRLPTTRRAKPYVAGWLSLTTPRRQVPTLSHRGILNKIVKKALPTANLMRTTPPSVPPSTNGTVEVGLARMRSLMRLVNELVSLRRKIAYIKKMKTSAQITTLETNNKEDVNRGTGAKKNSTMLNVESMKDIQKLLSNDSDFTLFENRRDTKISNAIF